LESEFFGDFIQDILRGADDGSAAGLPPHPAALAVGGQNGEPDITVITVLPKRKKSVSGYGLVLGETNLTLFPRRRGCARGSSLPVSRAGRALCCNPLARGSLRIGEWSNHVGLAKRESWCSCRFRVFSAPHPGRSRQRPGPGG